MPPKPVPGINPPSPPIFNGVHVKESWKLFKQKWENYCIITQLTNHPRQYQVALLLHAVGDEGLRIYNGFTFETQADARTTNEIIAKFDNFAVGEINETYGRFVFNQGCQSPDENFETFMTSIRTLIKTCNYHQGSVDSILRDRIVLGVIDKETQKRLLREADLTLVKCIAICKAAENASEQVKALNPPSSNNHVNMTKKQTTYSHKPQSTSKHTPPVLDCKFCGKKACVA